MKHAYEFPFFSVSWRLNFADVCTALTRETVHSRFTFSYMTPGAAENIWGSHGTKPNKSRINSSSPKKAKLSLAGPAVRHLVLFCLLQYSVVCKLPVLDLWRCSECEKQSRAACLNRLVKEISYLFHILAIWQARLWLQGHVDDSYAQAKWVRASATLIWLLLGPRTAVFIYTLLHFYLIYFVCKFLLVCLPKLSSPPLRLDLSMNLD